MKRMPRRIQLSTLRLFSIPNSLTTRMTLKEQKYTCSNHYFISAAGFGVSPSMTALRVLLMRSSVVFLAVTIIVAPAIAWQICQGCRPLQFLEAPGWS